MMAREYTIDLLDISNSYRILKTDYCCPTWLEAFHIASSSAPFSESYQHSLRGRTSASCKSQPEISRQLTRLYRPPSYFLTAVGCSLFFQWSLMLLATAIRCSFDTLSCMLSITPLTVLMWLASLLSSRNRKNLH